MMSSTVDLVHEAAIPPRWEVEICADSERFWSEWAGWSAEVPTPFQSTAWLTDWYATMGAMNGLSPVLVRVANARQPEVPLLMWPLVQERRYGLKLLRAPDQGVSDYNTPRCSAAALNLGLPETEGFLTAVRRALRRQGDILRIAKMLPTIGGCAQPLAAMPSRRADPVSGFGFQVPDDWAAHRQAQSRQQRREAERHWRVFQRWPDAQFELIQRADVAEQALAELEFMQRRRMGQRADYHLDQQDHQALYHARLQRGVNDGSVVISRLRVGEQTIAVAYGLRHADQVCFVRVAFSGDEWKACAPGRLLLDRTCQALHQQGCRRFDIGVGESAYKLSLGCQPVPLLTICEPLTARGWPLVTAWRSARRLREGAQAEPSGPLSAHAPAAT
jgi:CelD/BcsL family acetyltransferase involved in cellulose biosynthesis